ncbi:MAG TPA: PGPGW domain-containing protein [Burkholderiales bacterium]
MLLPLPGPGLLVIAAGVLLMAEESHVTARALDWLEIQARKLARH